MRLDPSHMRRAWRFVDYQIFFNENERRHVRSAIGHASEGFTDLPAALRLANFGDNVLMKIDIEGAEYAILDQIIDNRMRFCGIVMELHDIDTNYPAIDAFLAATNPDFELVHFHASNRMRGRPADFSKVVEISLINRLLLKDGGALEARVLPIADLNAKNVPDAPDILVNFE